SIWTGHETVICRLGVVRIRQIPGSRSSSFAASSNSVSIASKRLPVPPFGAISDDSIVLGPTSSGRRPDAVAAARWRGQTAWRLLRTRLNFRPSSVYHTSALLGSSVRFARERASLYVVQVVS